MNQIDDERIKFYLRHQRRIEEWSALGREVPKVAHRFLCSCQDDMEALAQELGPDVHVHADTESDYSKLSLYRPVWCHGNAHDQAGGELRIAISIEWRPKVVGFLGRDNCPYVGVWVHLQCEGGQQLRDDAGRVFRASRLLTEQGQQLATQWWPVRDLVPAQGEYWDDLSLYRRQLVDSVRAYWQKFAPTIDRLVT